MPADNEEGYPRCLLQMQCMFWSPHLHLPCMLALQQAQLNLYAANSYIVIVFMSSRVACFVSPCHSLVSFFSSLLTNFVPVLQSMLSTPLRTVYV